MYTQYRVVHWNPDSKQRSFGGLSAFSRITATTGTTQNYSWVWLVKSSSRSLGDFTTIYTPHKPKCHLESPPLILQQSPKAGSPSSAAPYALKMRRKRYLCSEGSPLGGTSSPSLGISIRWLGLMLSKNTLKAMGVSEEASWLS